MRHQGRITSWKDDQGYGFIKPNGGGEPVFLHIKAFSGNGPRPLGEEIVTYELTRDGKGRRRADSVKFVRGTGRLRSTSNAMPTRWPQTLAALFFIFLGASAIAGKMPPLLFALYAGTSLIAFAAYWLDKSAARDGRRRIAESTLHLLALIGGWPGALLAQHRLRHKVAKPPFLAVFWLTVLLNSTLLGLLLSPAANRALRTVLGVA